MKKILIITNKDDPHSDYVLPKMERYGLHVYRLNTEDISKSFEITVRPTNLQESHINFNLFGLLYFSEINGVWYRRPIQPKLDTIQEKYRNITMKEISGAFQGFYSSLEDKCLWVNHPFLVRQAENKLYQLKHAHQIGFLTPKSCITQNPQVARDFIENCKNGVIVKTLSGEIISDEEGIKSVYTHLLSKKDMSNLDEIKNCPTFFQENIEKEIELRITVIGKQVFTVAINTQEDSESKNDWRRGIISGKLKYSIFELPENIKRFCVTLTQSLGLNFGAIDMIKSKSDEYIFLEINPNGQWLWLEIETGIAISDALIKMFVKTSSDI